MLEKWTRREDNNETKRENWMKWTDTWGMAARIKPTESSEKAKNSRWIEFAHVWFSTKIWIFDSQWWLAGQREIGYHRAFGNAIVKDLENITKRSGQNQEVKRVGVGFGRQAIFITTRGTQLNFKSVFQCFYIFSCFCFWDIAAC